MKMKIVLLCILCFVSVSFSGCIDDSEPEDSEETTKSTITPAIDCNSDLNSNYSVLLSSEDFDKFDQNKTVVWLVTKVEDGPVKWEDCSWQLIDKAGSENDENATVDFTDRDDDGKISKNDYFIVTPSVRGNYSFKIIFQSTGEYAFISSFKFYSNLFVLPAGNKTPALCLAQNSALEVNDTWVNFTIHCTSANANWSDMRIIIDSSIGGELNLSTPTFTEIPAAGSCGYSGDSDSINVTDLLYCHTDTILTSGDTLKIIYIPTNTMTLQKTIS